MGAQTSCGGEQTSREQLEGGMCRVVLCRAGPYTEGYVEWALLRRDPPDGVVAYAEDECSLVDVVGGASEQQAKVHKGDKCFLLTGEVAGGSEALRFGLGDRVQCYVSTESGMEWMPGTIVGLWYHEEKWSRVAPYQVRIDGTPGQYIFAPHDDPALIVEHDDRPLACGIIRYGDGDGEGLTDGASVIYCGGGRFAGDVQLLKEWTLTIGHPGTVMKYHGKERNRGVWPVDVLFKMPNGAGVPIALTAKDIRLAPESDPKRPIERICDNPNACPHAQTNQGAATPSEQPAPSAEGAKSEAAAPEPEQTQSGAAP